jgi:hypothetical protein
MTGNDRGVGASWASAYRPDVSFGVGLRSAARAEEDIMQIGSCNVRRIVIAVIVLVVGGLTPTAALANTPHFKKGREPSCLIARSAISKSATCRAVLAGLAVPASVPANNNSLPYDEFGLGANQPNQPRVGSVGPQTGRAVAEVAVPASVPDNNNSLPYDEFGLGANQPNQPRVGSVGP